MASGAQSQISIVPEVTFGVNPGGNYTILPYANENFRQNRDTTESTLIKSGRRPSDSVTNNEGLEGTLAGEFLYSDYNQLILGSMGYDFVGTPLVDNSTFSYNVEMQSIVTAGGGFARIIDSDSGAGVSGDIQTNLPIGQFVEARQDTGDNGNDLTVFKVVAHPAANQVDVQYADFTDDAGPTAFTLAIAGQAVDGGTSTTFHAERNYGDLSDPHKYVELLGLLPTGMSMSVNQGSIPTINFTMTGRSEQTAATQVSGGYNAVSGERVFGNTRDFKGFFENGENICILSANFNLTNATVDNTCIGDVGPRSLVLDALSFTGDFTYDYTTSTLYDRFLSDSASSVAMIWRDLSGNVQIWEVPLVQYTGTSGRGSEGRGTLIRPQVTWRALEDTTTGLEAVVRYANIAAA